LPRDERAPAPVNRAGSVPGSAGPTTSSAATGFWLPVLRFLRRGPDASAPAAGSPAPESLTVGPVPVTSAAVGSAAADSAAVGSAAADSAAVGSAAADSTAADSAAADSDTPLPASATAPDAASPV